MKTEISDNMSKSFLVYCRRDQIHTAISSGLLDHAASGQFGHLVPVGYQLQAMRKLARLRNHYKTTGLRRRSHLQSLEGSQPQLVCSGRLLP